MQVLFVHYGYGYFLSATHISVPIVKYLACALCEMKYIHAPQARNSQKVSSEPKAL